MLLHGTSAWASLPSLVNIASPSALSRRRRKNKKIRKAQQTVSHFFPHNCEKVKKEKQEDLFFFLRLWPNTNNSSHYKRNNLWYGDSLGKKDLAPRQGRKDVLNK